MKKRFAGDIIIALCCSCVQQYEDRFDGLNEIGAEYVYLTVYMEKSATHSLLNLKLGRK